MANELTAAELQTLLDQKTAENETLLKANADLKELNDTHQKDLGIKDQNLIEALKLIDEQQAALSKSEAAAVSGDGPVIIHDKKKYRVNIPKFSFGGQEYSAADLKANKELVATLLKKGSGVLSPVDEK